LTIPQVDTPGPATITVTTPFTASGGIVARDFNGGEALVMEGQGTATIVLSLAFPTAYRLQSAHYEFTAVPEPGTAALILMGFFGVCFWHSRSWRFPGPKRDWRCFPPMLMFFAPGRRLGR